MQSWQTATQTFDLAAIMARLTGSPTSMNAAIECCDRHPPYRIALHYESPTAPAAPP